MTVLLSELQKAFASIKYLRLLLPFATKWKIQCRDLLFRGHGFMFLIATPIQFLKHMLEWGLDDVV